MDCELKMKKWRQDLRIMLFKWCKIKVSCSHQKKGISTYHLFYYLPMHIGQAKVATLELIGQFFVVHAQ